MWVTNLIDAKLSDILPPSPVEVEKALSIDDIIAVENSLDEQLERPLSSVEQLLLAKYYIFGESNFVDLIGQLDEYDINKVKQYATNFKRVLYLYSHDKLISIQLMGARENSIKQFKSQVHTCNINTFVKDLYFSQYKNLKTVCSTDLLNEKSRISIFRLNHDRIKLLSPREEKSESELIEFLKVCQPTFTLEPNRLKFTEELSQKYAIRLLASIFNEVYFIVNKDSNVELIAAQHPLL